jgi:hypothetical protein
MVLALLLTGCDQPAVAPTPDAVQVPVDSAAGAVYPGRTWQSAETPEDLGWSSAKLAVAREFSEQLDSAAVMIVDDGNGDRVKTATARIDNRIEIVYERQG